MTGMRLNGETEIDAAVLELARELMLIPTATDSPKEILRALEIVGYHLEACSRLDIQFPEKNGVVSLLALPKDDETPRLILAGHIDMIPLSPETRFISHLENGRICGPGAADMKCMVAALIVLFVHFHRSMKGSPSLGFALTSDEEIGGENGMGYIFGEYGLRCGGLILPDSGRITEIAEAEKGIIHAGVTFRGEGGHSARPWLLENPLKELVEFLVPLQKRFDDLSRADHWNPTCSINAVTTSHRVPNRVPDEAEAMLDIRFTPEYSRDEIIEIVRESLPSSATLKINVEAPPTLLRPDPDYIRITEEVVGRPAKLIREHGGSDGQFAADHGIPVMMSRPEHGNMHTAKEWVDLKSLSLFTEVCRRYIERKVSGRS